MEKYNLTQTGQEVQDILNEATPQSELTAETERAQEAEQTLQGNIDAEATRAQGAEGTLQDNIDAEETRAKAAEKQNADDIDAIEEKIPSAASSENQLADKSFVNSSIATATATFRGTFNMVSDLHLTLDATEQQIATALALAIDTADNNDYCFLQVPTSVDTPTVIESVDRYKFNGSSWAYEYTLNNSGYTQAQWNAINSGITSGDVTKLEALPTNAQLTTLLNGKQNVLTFDNVPTRNSDNPVKSSGVFNSIEAILALIPSAASVVNQLADKAFVNSSIATATATFRGTYNLVTDLDLTISATYSDIASALADVVSGADNNDYAFVQIPTSDATPTQIAKTVRFKFNGTSWEYEYDLNNSGYTAAQWAAINSGITAALVAKLNGLPTNEALQLALNAITQDIGNLEAVVPTEATSSNQLADKAFVLNEILLATTAFKGQFTTLAQLQAVTGAKTGDMGIVRTKDNDGKDVFTFYQYKDDQWNEFYTLEYHPQNKPATTGIIGSYPFNGMGRVELPMNLVDGWPNDTWLYLPVNGVVYLLYSWNLQLYAVYNSGSQEGLGLENNIVIEPANYNIADIAELVGSRYLSYTEAGGVFTITKPDTTTITSTVLNNTTIYKEDDTDHHGINLLTQSMLNKTNTIYVIQYDYVLGEDITIPANSVLEFDGGSISGEYTITGQNTLIESINENIFNGVLFAGSFLTLEILANWFSAENDAQMFQKAFDFARKVYEGTQGYYEIANPKVTCLTKVYHIDDTINIKYGISFDGNGAQLNPTVNLENKWMFKYNIAANGTSWETAYTSGDGIHFCNFSYSNPDSILSHFLFTGSPIRIHDIKAFRPAKFIYFTGNYIDKKYIKNCNIAENARFPLDTNNYYDTCSIRLGLGDSCEISNISEISNGVYIGQSGQVRIDGAINVGMYICDCNSVSLRNFHNESGIIYVQHSTISIEDSYFWANQNGNIKFITTNNKFGEVSLKNCVFSKLKALTDFHSYYPITGYGKVICENIFGLIYPTPANDHNNGHYIGLKYDANTYINCNRFIASNKVLDDYVQLESGTYTTLNVTSGNDAHIRMFLLADKSRGLYLTANNTAVDKAISLNSVITLYDIYAPTRLSNAILRIEIGDTDSYTHYFDFPIVNQNKENIAISKKDGVFYLEDIPFKAIDYTTTYINCSYYRRENERIYAELNTLLLPNISKFKLGDKIKLNNKFTFVRNNAWINDNTFSEASEVSNGWVCFLKKNKRKSMYDRVPTRVTLAAVNATSNVSAVNLLINGTNIKIFSKTNDRTITKVAYKEDGDYVLFYCYINANHIVLNCIIDGLSNWDDYIDKSMTVVSLPSGAVEKVIASQGPTSERNFNATDSSNMCYFDTDLKKPIWRDGTTWVDATGAIAGTSTSGTFANKPTVSANNIPVGFKYFCTDKQTTEGATNGIEIIHKGNDIWVDALGRIVS